MLHFSFKICYNNKKGGAAMRNFMNWLLIAFLWILAILVYILCFG